MLRTHRGCMPAPPARRRERTRAAWPDATARLLGFAGGIVGLMDLFRGKRKAKMPPPPIARPLPPLPNHQANQQNRQPPIA